MYNPNTIVFSGVSAAENYSFAWKATEDTGLIVTFRVFSIPRVLGKGLLMFTFTINDY